MTEDDELAPRFSRRIRFRMGDVFPPHDPVAQWIANLSRALNDLLLARRRLKRGFADDTPAYEHFYDIRAIATHAWELAKFLYESEREAEEISTFVASLPEDVVAHHRYAVEVLYRDSGDSGNEFKKRLASARDQAIHYSRIDHKLMRSSLARLRDLEADILVDQRWGDFRAEFAATLDAQLFFAVEDDTEPFERFSEELNELSGRLMRFARIAIDQYLLRRQELLTVDPI